VITKESITVSTSELVRISRKPKYEGKKCGFSKGAGKKCPALKEQQEKKYPFPYSDLSRMLDNLLKKAVVELLESKHLEKAKRVTDIKYC